MLGICKNITTEWRYLPVCYRGMGLNNLTIEARTACLNAFLQHYGTDTSIGIYLTASIENLQLEMGVAGCPFDYNYVTWNKLATDSWVKSLWEQIQKLDLPVENDYKTLKMPREKDEYIIERLVHEGFFGAKLVSIH